MIIPVTSVIVERHVRQDLGDLTSLKKSLQHLGQLMPLGVTRRKQGTSFAYVLIHGQRRLEAARQLGWTEIAVRVLDTSDDLVRLMAERDENIERKELTLSERAEFAKLIEPMEKAAAKERQIEGAKHGGKAAGKLIEASTGNAKVKVAKAVGLSRNTLVKVQEVAAAAEANPTKFGHLKAEMDRTNKVNGPHAKLQAAQQAEAPTANAKANSVTSSDTEDRFIGVIDKACACLTEFEAGRNGAPLSPLVIAKLNALATVTNRLLTA